MKAVKLGNKLIGPDCPTFIIAEAGLNHNGDLTLAKKLVDMAVAAGADCVKFQKRDVDNLAIQSVLDAKDERFPTFGATYREIREHIEFSMEEYRELKGYCDQQGILFLCTSFDHRSTAFLEELGIEAYKIASHSLTNLPLIEALSKLQKPLFLSTGMCTLEEIDATVKIIQRNGAPLVLFHCVSSYPQPAQDSNLRMIEVLRNRYEVPVGYSGHEIGFTPTLAAVAMGACAVERHITTDKTLVGFDHKISLEPQELKAMCDGIREVEQCFGTGEKTILEKEWITRHKYHVSIVAACDIPKGTMITEAMLTLKNPGTGLESCEMPKILGQKATCDIAADTLLSFEMVSQGVAV